MPRSISWPPPPAKAATAARAALLHSLLERATASEQDFLIRPLVGEERQGALEA